MCWFFREEKTALRVKFNLSSVIQLCSLFQINVIRVNSVSLSTETKTNCKAKWKNSDLATWQSIIIYFMIRIFHCNVLQIVQKPQLFRDKAHVYYSVLILYEDGPKVIILHTGWDQTLRIAITHQLAFLYRNYFWGLG